MGDHDISSWVPLLFSLVAIALSLVSLFLGHRTGVREAERRKDILVYQAQESLQLLTRDTTVLWRFVNQHKRFYQQDVARRIQTNDFIFRLREDKTAWKNRPFLADGCKAALALHPYLFDDSPQIPFQIGQMQNGEIRPWDVKELAGKMVEHQWKSILKEGTLDDQQRHVGYAVFSLCLPIYVADWLHGYREKHLLQTNNEALVVGSDAWEQDWDDRDREGELQLLYRIAQACREDSEAVIKDAVGFISQAFGLHLPGPELLSQSKESVSSIAACCRDV